MSSMLFLILPPSESLECALNLFLHSVLYKLHADIQVIGNRSWPVTFTGVKKLKNCSRSPVVTYDEELNLLTLVVIWHVCL